jgi:enoyl-CoA hydratase/carnithine racemase
MGPRVMGSIGTNLDSGVFTITFDRPDKKNAFTLSMYKGLVEALRRVDDDPAIRVAVLTGAGDAFTSGNDLNDFMSDPPEAGETHPVLEFLAAIVEAEKPIIAAVNGLAIGIGTTMLLHADLVYASEKARFQLPFVNLALVPEGASSFLLPRMVGHQKASELLLFGEPFDAKTALDVGLVNQVLEAPRLMDHVRDRARTLAAKPRTAVKRTKRLLKDPRRDEVKRAIEREGELFVQCLASPESLEAIRAFFEKRKPEFSKLP